MIADLCRNGAVTIGETKLGINQSEIGTNSICSGAAMAMYVSILVTPVFGHKKEFVFLNIRKVFGDLFQRSHNSVSLLLQFLCNSKHLTT
jgi:hypothetical protein